MDNREIDKLNAEIEATKASIAERASEIEHLVTDDVQERLHRLTPAYQAKKHPWMMVGGAVAAGIVVGHVMTAPSSRPRRATSGGSGERRASEPSPVLRFAGLLAFGIVKEVVGPNPILSGIEKALFKLEPL